RGRAPAEAAEPVVAAWRGAARVVRVGEPPVRAGLPGLDQPVGDDVPGTVVHPAHDRDGAGGALRYHVRAVGPRQPHREVRPHGLRRSYPEHVSLLIRTYYSNTDEARPRSTMSQV